MKPKEKDPITLHVETVKIEGDRNLYRYSFEIDEDEAETETDGSGADGASQGTVE